MKKLFVDISFVPHKNNKTNRQDKFLGILAWKKIGRESISTAWEAYYRLQIALSAKNYIFVPLTPKDECMIKGILKYSLLSLLVSVMEWMFLPEIDSLSNISNDHTLISLLSILPVIITAIGTFLFYRKNKDDDKRIMRSSLFFIATLILTGVLLLITIVLVFSIQNKK